MPVAVLVGGLAVIALAFAAIAADLLIRQFIINPAKGAASSVSEVAIVGGAIAWGLTLFVNAVETVLAGVDALVNTAKAQAADMWNFLVNGTVQTQFSGPMYAAQWLSDHLGAIQWILNYWATLWDGVFKVAIPLSQAATGDLAGLHKWIDGYELPLIRGIGNDLAGLHQWIDGYELPLIRGIGDDLAGLHRWIDANVVNRGDLAQAQAQTLAQVQTLVVPIEQAITDVENSPCMQFCEPLGDLGQLLQGLEDAGMLAILLGLAAEVRSDPAGVQQALRATVIPIIQDAASSIGVGL